MIIKQREILHRLVFILCLLGTSCVHGFPITADFFDDGRCDLIPDQDLSHQLGLAPAFPIDERVSLRSIESNANAVCIPSDPDLSDNFEVTIRNESSVAWKDLFLVASTGVSFGNADGQVRQPLDIGPFRDAFRIDAIGSNSNLISESLNTNGIFEPNEIWIFVVTDYAAGGVGLPLFSSLGLDGSSDPAHLLGNPVPIPAAVWLFGSGLLGLVGMARRKKSI